MLPVLVELGPLRVPAYGFFVALGYLAAIIWLRRRRDAMGLTEDQFWAAVYWVFFGLLLSPMIAAAAMSLSSVSVIGNALRLRNAKL